MAAGARQHERNLPLSQISEVTAVVARVRTNTVDYLRSEVKTGLRALRDELPEDDRTLLVLRIDKGMGWREIAAAMSDGDLADDEVARETARLRKRYQLATERLRTLAHERGLLGGTRD